MGINGGMSFTGDPAFGKPPGGGNGKGGFPGGGIPRPAPFAMLTWLAWLSQEQV